MSRFIAVDDVNSVGNNREVLVNLDWVEEVRPTKDGGACIFYAFRSCEGNSIQDRLVTDRPYQLVRQAILNKGNG